MGDTIIENPVINSPFAEPKKHFRFSDEGITNEISEERRISSYFIPIAQPKKKSTQLSFETEWTKDRLEENVFINQVRARVANWRRAGYLGVTRTTRSLLKYWTRAERERKLFFCQIEALETIIYITEVAAKSNDNWIENTLRLKNEQANAPLYRMALKMATGSGKTVVMAMLIAWQALNKIENSQDRRFSDAFLVVAPGITIKDRLRVLLPNDPDNYYAQRDILPGSMLERLGRAKIVITNFHAFKRRERGEAAKASKLTKSILAGNTADPENAFVESPAQMARRVCRELGNKKNIVVLNDEAHHCYAHNPEHAASGEAVAVTSGSVEKLKGEELTAAKDRAATGKIWLNGLRAVKDKLGIKVVYDLSATPFFLKGSGYAEGTLFPWVVSDFSLIDAIESGIVKVPRVPVVDNTMSGDAPTYRDLWRHVRDELPKKGRKTTALGGAPNLPAELDGALRALYGNYEKSYRAWEKNAEARAQGRTPPVMIVVCSNTNVSKLVYDHVAGWEKALPDGSSLVVPGQLPIFNNERDGAWASRPNTILIDSKQLESGEAMSADFKKIAAREIEEFKAEYRERFPGRDIEDVSDEDLLREVMNTVGKSGKLGEHVKCVISVSMLTEGWDANTVTHVLGVRAFGTQLLCEQVVGRGLRRVSYATNDDGLLDPEYAEVYGVPFSFIPASGSQAEPKIGSTPTRVRSLDERQHLRITFPRLTGYRYEITEDKLAAKFDDESMLPLSTANIPTITESRPIVGESSVGTLDDLRERRKQEVAFLLAKLVLEKYFRADGESREYRTQEHRFDAGVQMWMFPQVLRISREWLKKCVVCKDDTFPQLLLLIEYAHDAADRIYGSIVRAQSGVQYLTPILRAYDPVGSTDSVDFDTTRQVYETDPDKCHISHVVLDSGWEAKMAGTLEGMEEVVRYVKNHNLGFQIPYTLEGVEHNYVPDFVACVDDGHGDDLLNLVVEVSGEKRKDKDVKVATARNMWVPAVNNHGSFGRWAFIEVSDPYDAKNLIRTTLKSLANTNEKELV